MEESFGERLGTVETLLSLISELISRKISAKLREVVDIVEELFLIGWPARESQLKCFKEFSNGFNSIWQSSS